jgi:hypothetical protein
MKAAYLSISKTGITAFAKAMASQADAGYNVSH